jgi:hypothetical protein
MLLNGHQMAVLREIGEAGFVVRMMTHLRAMFPESLGAVPDAELRAGILAAVRRAEEYGLADLFNLCRFVEYAYFLRPDFDTWYDDAYDVLSRPGLDATAKMDRIDATFGNGPPGGPGGSRG